jgi:hypothetical protein
MVASPRNIEVRALVVGEIKAPDYKVGAVDHRRCRADPAVADSKNVGQQIQARGHHDIGLLLRLPSVEKRIATRAPVGGLAVLLRVHIHDCVGTIAATMIQAIVQTG